MDSILKKRHTWDHVIRKESETINVPRILVCLCQYPSLICVGKDIEEKLGISLDGVDTRVDKKSKDSFDVIKTKSAINYISKIGYRNLQIEVVIKPLYIICINNGQEATIILANYPSFVFLRNAARRRYSAPIAQLRGQIRQFHYVSSCPNLLVRARLQYAEY